MKTVYDEWTKLKKVLIGKSFKVDHILDDNKLKILLDYEHEVNHRYNKYLDNNVSNHIRSTAESLFDIFDSPTIDVLKKVHDETNEDLNALADICKSFGAEVVRPNLRYGVERQLEHPMQCRDTVGKIGNTIFEINTAINEYSTDIQKYTAQVDRYTKEYSWYQDQYVRLDAKFKESLQVLIAN